jgi:WD40 repeat protein
MASSRKKERRELLAAHYKQKVAFQNTENLVAQKSMTTSEAILDLKWKGKRIAYALANGRIGVYDSFLDVSREEECDMLETLTVEWISEDIFVSGGTDGKMKFWNVGKDMILKISETIKASNDNSWISHLLYISSRSVLVSVCGKTVRLWNPDRTYFELPAHSSTVLGLHWSSPLGSLLTASYGNVYLWDLNDLPTITEPMINFDVKGSFISSQASPSGGLILAGMQEGFIN